jgi:glycosyltransferase involved in cell wall biosynthesis
VGSQAPLVAIVTPVYNGETFLAEAMSAVQRQSYPNLRHIVLDNASTDATPEILAQYRNARVPVEVTRNEQTLPVARNWNRAVGLTPKSAKYFRMLCADDLMAPECVERTVELAERHPETIAVGCGLRHRQADPTDARWDPNREVFPGHEAIRCVFSGAGLIIAHQALFRRSALSLRKPFFDEALAAIDTDACLDLLRVGDWGFVHEVLATTRDHPRTRSRTFVATTHTNDRDHLVMLERYAPYAFGAEAGWRVVRQYRRAYTRKILRWRLTTPRSLYEPHLAVIRRRDRRPLFWQFLEAVADWPLTRLGLRRPVPSDGAELSARSLAHPARFLPAPRRPAAWPPA